MSDPYKKWRNKMADKKKKNLHVKAGDRVILTAGKDKGKIGNVKKQYLLNQKLS